ncbi:MAG: T9SS type A sorting domain-containing protein [Crocinitomicaceae bacterium]|nr:T9SS type A sorting domain-containing protein [Crocinitomicaceae bacterium]
MFWKRRNAAVPSYIDEQNNITEERGNNFSLVTSPVDQTIEVQSESDDLATFQLLDNAGRVVELRDVSNNNNVYRIDITHLSGGMYFLHCSSAAGEEVLRVLQVNK